MRNPILQRAVTAALLAGFVAGAAAATGASQPGPAVPDRFTWAPTDSSIAPNSEVEFWRGFGDAQLTALV